MSSFLLNKTVKRTWDWLAVILLILLMQIAAARLVATLWTLDLNLILVVTFLATILGVLLGISQYRSFWVVFFSLAYGCIVIPWQFGLTLDPDIVWRDRLLNLWGRLGIVIQELLSRKPITDNLLFLLLMAVMFWALAVYAGVVLIREANPWKVVIPAGIVAFVINTFDPLLAVRSIYLAVYLLFALFLVARLEFIKNSTRWSERHAHTPSDMSFELSRVALILSVVLVFFAWNLPVLSDTLKPVEDLWHETSKPWLSLKDRFSFMFASLQASATSVENFYSATLPLGLGSPLSNQVVMEVQAPSTPPGGTRYYWEARTYDTYKNDTWSSSLKTPQSLNAQSKDLAQPGADARAVETFTFFPYQTITNIYAPPEALWTSLPVQAYMENNHDGTVDLSSLLSKSYVRPGEQYTVRSALDSVTVKQLKNAGTDYPSWVTDEYLQLPNDITPRTRQLAKDIASDLTDPYDITSAVTSYLRANIQYDLTIDKPPSNKERIDWFLFDYKKGFCNYYASAEVILLRSLGIPARMAVGFAQGDLENTTQTASPTVTSPIDGAAQKGDTETFVVRQNNAHAWPEVFFPGVGWVIFEPTVSQAALSRPSGEDVASYDMIEAGRARANQVQHEELGSERQLPDGNSSSSTGGPQSFWTTWNIILFVAAQFAIGLIVILVWQVMRGFRLYPFMERVSIGIPETMVKGLRKLGIPPPDFLSSWIFYLKLPPASRSYLEINHALERLGNKLSPNHTPSERAELLIAALPSAEIPAHQLLGEYHRSIYSLHSADLNAARKSAQEIRYLSWQQSIHRYALRIKSIFKRRKKLSGDDSAGVN
jgi:transglutaminase-like putative cysteine protease